MATATVRPRAKAKGGEAGSVQRLDRKRVVRSASLFQTVGDETRLSVILTLAHGEMNVGALCETMGMSQPAVSHHLARLRYTGLVECNRDGKFNVYSLTERGRLMAQAEAAVAEASIGD